MENVNDQLEEVEVSIDEAKQSIKDAESFQRLSRNKDFQHVIEKMYFNDEAVRLTMMKGSQVPEEIKKQMELESYGISALYNFFIRIVSLAQQQRQAMGEDEATREEMLEEAI